MWNTRHHLELWLLNQLSNGYAIGCAATVVVFQKHSKWIGGHVERIRTAKVSNWTKFYHSTNRIISKINILSNRYPSHDYRRVYSLVRHENQRQTYSFLQYAFMSTFLVKFLEASHYFDSDISNLNADEYEQDKHFVGSLILRNLQVLQFNSHEIFDLLKSEKTGLRQTVAIGAGLYTTLALFNHSCNPSIVRWADIHEDSGRFSSHNFFSSYSSLFNLPGK